MWYNYNILTFIVGLILFVVKHTLVNANSHIIRINIKSIILYQGQVEKKYYLLLEFVIIITK